MREFLGRREAPTNRKATMMSYFANVTESGGPVRIVRSEWEATPRPNTWAELVAEAREMAALGHGVPLTIDGVVVATAFRNVRDADGVLTFDVTLTGDEYDERD
jgi:hypothetical protein